MWQTVWTVGHSTRPIEEFLAILDAHGIELVADVRRYPGSRRLPQFEAGALETALAARGVAYRWFPDLGGRRRPDPASINTGWRHPAFRAYADHVATEEFADGLIELLMLAQGLRTAVMCAEILWWRCHRRVIADVATSLGVPVLHIRDEREAELHRLAPPARLSAGRLSYEGEPAPGGRDPRAQRRPREVAVATKKSGASEKGESPSRLIDARIEELGDWRGEMLSTLRALIRRADPGVVEEWKWGGPVWSHDGVICTGESYKSHVKLTFLKGAQLKDPGGLFNASLEGNARRAIDFHEGDEVEEAAFQALVREAAALNARTRSGAKAERE